MAAAGQAPSGLAPRVLPRIPTISNDRRKRKSTKDVADSCEQGVARALDTISKAKRVRKGRRLKGGCVNPGGSPGLRFLEDPSPSLAPQRH